MDEEKRKLERKAKEGDPQALISLQRLNTRSGYSEADVQYLQEYLKLNEEVISGQMTSESKTVNYGEADSYSYTTSRRSGRKRTVQELQAALNTLNQTYQFKVGENVIRKDLLALDAFQEGAQIGSWNASTVECEVAGSQSGDPDPNLEGYVGDVYGWPRERLHRSED